LRKFLLRRFMGRCERQLLAQVVALAAVAGVEHDHVDERRDGPTKKRVEDVKYEAAVSIRR
jgi:hypothetical protein